MDKLKEITFETNGTMRLTSAFKEYLTKWKITNHQLNREITFSVSSKLPASGEPWKDAIKPKVVCDYENYGTAYLKFVVATEQDIEDTLQAAKRAFAQL